MMSEIYSVQPITTNTPCITQPLNLLVKEEIIETDEEGIETDEEVIQTDEEVEHKGSSSNTAHSDYQLHDKVFTTVK